MKRAISASLKWRTAFALHRFIVFNLTAGNLVRV